MVHPSFYGSTRNDAYFLFWKLMTAAARRLVSGLALAGLPPWEAPARPIRMAFLIPEFRGRFVAPPPPQKTPDRPSIRIVLQGAASKAGKSRLRDGMMLVNLQHEQGRAPGQRARQYGSAVETIYMGQGAHGQTRQEMKGIAHGLEP